jgi:hypothetical protein
MVEIDVLPQVNILSVVALNHLIPVRPNSFNESLWIVEYIVRKFVERGVDILVY